MRKQWGREQEKEFSLLSFSCIPSFIVFWFDLIIYITQTKNTPKSRLLCRLAYLLCIGQIEASTCPGIPRAFDTFAIPGRREFGYQNLPSFVPYLKYLNFQVFDVGFRLWMYEYILLLCLQWNTIPIWAIQYNNIK